MKANLMKLPSSRSKWAFSKLIENRSKRARPVFSDYLIHSEIRRCHIRSIFGSYFQFLSAPSLAKTFYVGIA